MHQKPSRSILPVTEFDPNPRWPAGYFEVLEEAGQDIRTVQELLGQVDVKTTMIYTQVLNQGPLGRWWCPELNLKGVFSEKDRRFKCFTEQSRRGPKVRANTSPVRLRAKGPRAGRDPVATMTAGRRSAPITTTPRFR